MSYSEGSNWTDRTCGYFSAILNSYSGILSCLKIHQSVHPLQPIAPPHSEFFEVTSCRRLRVIHMRPEKNLLEPNHKSKDTVDDSRIYRVSSEEYWFTRWNRPLRGSICNCSFRRSKRFSKLSDQLSRHSSIRRSLMQTINPDISSKKNIENFVEKLISDTLLAAFQECVKTKSITNTANGIVNVAYVNDEIELNNPCQKSLKNVEIDNQSIKVQNNLRSSTINCEVIKRVKSNKSSRGHCGHSSSKNSSKPLILLLHGIGSSADIWWNVLDCLVGAGYEVIAPDMLGHGYSSVPNSAKAYTFQNLLKDLIALFDKYISSNELGQCIVIGHSFGCSLAGALARYRAQQVVQLILISGGGPTPLAPPVSSSEVSVFSCLQILLKPLLFCGMKRAMFFSSRGKHFEVCDVSAVPPHILHYISEGQYWPEGDAAFHRRILIPTLLVHGLQDTYVTLVQECEMERTIPRSFLEVIPTAGHMAMIEAPDQLCHMLLCFIDWWTK